MTGLDKIDFKILKILQENGRITNIQLSSDIGLSPAPTLERVRKLEQTGIIESYHALVNEDSVGLGVKSYLQVSINFNKKDVIKNFIKQINEIEEIIECYQVAGSTDFILKIVVSNIPAYERLLTEKISAIQEINKLNSMVVLKTVKKSRSLPINN
jgi:Lrp/AsnC family leucine-responsive transcriptional regulator